LPRACQAANPGFSGSTFTSFSQTGSSVTLTVIRPLEHATHPIKATGATSVIFATGPSSAEVPIEEHDDNKDVSYSTATELNHESLIFLAVDASLPYCLHPIMIHHTRELVSMASPWKASHRIMRPGHFTLFWDETLAM
jgi:hypothetical protein